jgi:hypothetical protein
MGLSKIPTASSPQRRRKERAKKRITAVFIFLFSIFRRIHSIEKLTDVSKIKASIKSNKVQFTSLFPSNISTFGMHNMMRITARMMN